MVGVGVFVGVGVLVFVGVLVGVFVGVFVSVFVGVLVGVLVGVFVGVLVGVGVCVLVGVGVLVLVTVGVTVGVRVLVGVGVAQIHIGSGVAVPPPLTTVTNVAQATVNSVFTLTEIISVVELQFTTLNVVNTPEVPPNKNHLVQQGFVLLGV